MKEENVNQLRRGIRFFKPLSIIGAFLMAGYFAYRLILRGIMNYPFYK